MPRIDKMRKSITALALAATCVSAAAQPSVDAHLAAAKKAEGQEPKSCHPKRALELQSSAQMPDGVNPN